MTNTGENISHRQYNARAVTSGPTSVFEVSKAQYDKCFHSVAPSFYTVSVERVNIKTGMEL